MESLREAVLPLYKDYSIVQRRVIIAQNIAKFTMGRQEVRILYCGFGLLPFGYFFNAPLASSADDGLAVAIGAA